MLDLTRSSSLASNFAAEPTGHAALEEPGKSRRSDFSARSIAILFAVLLAIAAIPILLNPLPPISDYINHLARMHIIATINSDFYLHRYYEIDWQVIPNLMMDIILPPFLRLMNVYLAGELYTLTSFALIMAGTLALHRSLFGRWSAMPLIASVLLYNDVFLVGTMNYVFGIGLMLFALATWIALRERGRTLRLSVSALFVLGLFFCHLFALGVYGVGLLAFESHRLYAGYFAARRNQGAQPARRALPTLLLDFVLTGVPFLLVPLLLTMSPTTGLWDFYWRLNDKLDGLMLAVNVYSYTITWTLCAVAVIAAGWGLYRRALSVHVLALTLLIVGAIVYMALPRVMFSTYMVDLRLPISLAYILVACFDADFRRPLARWMFAGALVLVLGLRVGDVEYKWSQLSATTQSFRQSVELLKRGGKVLVAYADPNGGDSLRDYGLVHADCIAIIERSALVTTAFTVVGKQVLHARPAYRSRVDTEDGTPPMIGRLVRVADSSDPNSSDYWRLWTKDYDYLYVLFTGPEYVNPDPTYLTKIFAGDRFVLYRIEKSQFAAAGKGVK